MGSINSVPVVSQVKSLVQVIAGDETGAKQTQEEFARTAIIVSQFNSLGHSIVGDNEEALRIQEEFASDMESFAESAPVVGHLVSAGHAIAGDLEKAEEVALASSKSTVVTLSAVAGLACGPGAPACGAALAASSNTIWDLSESAIVGESRGVVLGVENIVNGQSDAGEIFDVVAEQGMVAAGGALGVSGVKKGVTRLKSPKKGKLASRCKRGAEVEFINYQLPELPDFAKNALPGSLSDLDSVRWNDVDQSIGAIVSIFLIIKMFLVGHPASQTYFDEVCQAVRPGVDLLQCEKELVLAIRKYQDDEYQQDQPTPFQDSLRSLVFEMKQMMKRDQLGEGLINSICSSHFPTKASAEGMKAMFARCQSKFHAALASLSQVFLMFQPWEARTRVRRCAPRTQSALPSQVEITFLPKMDNVKISFSNKHVFSNDKFSHFNKGSLSRLDMDTLKAYRGNIDDVSRNTIIRQSDVAELSSNSVKTRTATVDGRTVSYWQTSDPLPILQVDNSLLRNSLDNSGVRRGRAIVRFAIDEQTGDIFHMDPPVFIQAETIKLLD